MLVFIIRKALVGWLLAWAAMQVSAGSLEESIAGLQRDWEVIRYQSPATERAARFEALAERSRQVSETHAGRSEPLIWEGIIVSSLAGEKGGLGALGLVKRARSLYEKAIAIDATALQGSAYNSLAVLYYKVPPWPISFGDKKKAGELLSRALELNPDGIDPNFFQGEYLAEIGQRPEAVTALERALRAPPRPGRNIADTGRQEEARALIAKLNAR
jgi:tetratricopeptide (TPR) repeat protein